MLFRSVLQKVFEPNPVKRISIQELRARILACPRLTSAPGMMEPSVSVVDADYPVAYENFETSSGSSFSSSAASIEGTMTPPDSTPATPLNQSVHVEYAAYNTKDTAPSRPESPSSDEFFHDVVHVENPVVLPTSLDFAPSTNRGFWNHFPLFRREEVQSINAQLAAHNSVRVF